LLPRINHTIGSTGALLFFWYMCVPIQLIADVDGISGIVNRWRPRLVDYGNRVWATQLLKVELLFVDADM
jgi:hypothetical protein